MAKSAKARKAVKAGQKRAAPKDFQKITNKVGKAKKAARNATNTSFTAKRINMPAQHGIEEKGDVVLKSGRMHAAACSSLSVSWHKTPNCRERATGLASAKLLQLRPFALLCTAMQVCQLSGELLSSRSVLTSHHRRSVLEMGTERTEINGTEEEKFGQEGERVGQ